jgi:hypothetical protein
MGYACPVCETPQRDGEHLANHLAFTAMLGDEAHEDWLADRAPGWDEAGPAELAERVVDHAEEIEYRDVFEDTAARHDHAGLDAGHQAVDHSQIDPDAARGRSDGTLDAEAENILQDARDMTRELLDGETGPSDSAASTADEGSSESVEDGGEGKDS